MKNRLKTYNEYLNESVRDFLKPKSTEDILRDLGDLEPNVMLIKSIKNNFIEGVKIALKKGADNNYAIKYASYHGNTEIVKLLLKDSRIDPSDDGNYVIRVASYHGYAKIVKLLLQDERVDPSAENNWSIRVASKYGHTEIVKLLLQDKRVRENLAENEIKKFERQIKGLNESVRDLMKPKSTEDILRDLGDLNPNEMLMKSAKNGFIEGVKLALERGADPSVKDNYAIRYSSERGYTEIVKLLLQDPRVDPSVGNNYAIRWSSYYGHIEVVRLLLKDKRVDSSADNNYAIKSASRNGHTKVVKLLLNDERVREKLTENGIKRYEEQTKDL